MKKMLERTYHRFVVGIYTPSLRQLLDGSPTNKDVIANSGAIINLCERLIPHMQGIESLTLEGSQEHREAAESLENLKSIYEKVKLYKEAGRLARETFGI